MVPTVPEPPPAWRENDPYAAIERAAELVAERAMAAVAAGEAARISDLAVARLMTAAVKLYAAKFAGGDGFRPLLGAGDEVVTPTEALTATTDLLRAVRLGPVEFGLWSRRRPPEHHLTTAAPPADLVR
ncbi:hypothetical protein J4558_22685 [Leptolyngbya sp. 15MV]|nr:hypothetical protein J4558_22685 [Leptolyngbya sp. 15MV]